MDGKNLRARTIKPLTRQLLGGLFLGRGLAGTVGPLITASTPWCFPTSGRGFGTHVTYWAVTGKLCKWRCQHQDINKAKDRVMWLRPRFLVSRSLFIETLWFKKAWRELFLTQWTWGQRSWKLVTLLVAWMTPLTRMCWRWLVVGVVADSRWRMDQTCQKPVRFLEATQRDTQYRWSYGSVPVRHIHLSGHSVSLYGEEM